MLKKFFNGNQRQPANQAPAGLGLVPGDREEFERRSLQLYYTQMNSAKAQEHFQILEEPPRPRGVLRRVV